MPCRWFVIFKCWNTNALGVPTRLGARRSLLCCEVAWMYPSTFVILGQPLLHEALLILTLKIVALSLVRRREAPLYAGVRRSSSFRSGSIHVVLDVVSNCVGLSLLSHVVYSLLWFQTAKIRCWIHQLRNFDMVVCRLKGAALIVGKSDIIWNWNLAIFELDGLCVVFALLYYHLLITILAFDRILSCIWH